MHEALSYTNEIHKLVQNDDLKAVFTKLFDSIPPDNDIYKELILHNSSYNRIEKAYRRGEIDFDKMMQNKNHIISALLAVFDEVEQLLIKELTELPPLEEEVNITRKVKSSEELHRISETDSKQVYYKWIRRIASSVAILIPLFFLVRYSIQYIGQEIYEVKESFNLMLVLILLLVLIILMIVAILLIFLSSKSNKKLSAPNADLFNSSHKEQTISKNLSQIEKLLIDQ